MASIKNLKKDINYVLGDVIQYALDVATLKNEAKKANPIVDEAIEVFDNLISKVNTNNVENKKAHFSSITQELKAKAKDLVEKVNAL